MAFAPTEFVGPFKCNQYWKISLKNLKTIKMAFAPTDMSDVSCLGHFQHHRADRHEADQLRFVQGRCGLYIQGSVWIGVWLCANRFQSAKYIRTRGGTSQDFSTLNSSHSSRVVALTRDLRVRVKTTTTLPTATFQLLNHFLAGLERAARGIWIIF